MKKSFLSLALAILTAVIITSVVNVKGVETNTNYYISPTKGNDNNNGLRTSFPWQHYPKDPLATGNSLAHTPTPGDIYHIIP